MPVSFVNDNDESTPLRRTGRHSDRAGSSLPGLVLLDLNMPGIGGFETLKVIRADVALRRLPVVILTTSAAHDDIVTSYDAGANAYIVKPSAFAGLVGVFQSLCSFWFDVSSSAREALD